MFVIEADIKTDVAELELALQFDIDPLTLLNIFACDDNEHYKKRYQQRNIKFFRVNSVHRGLIVKLVQTKVIKISFEKYYLIYLRSW